MLFLRNIMAVKLKWPWLGIAIPCLIIITCGYGTHYFVLHTYLSPEKQILYQVSLAILWIFYYLAITVEPGSPPLNFETPAGEWRRWCKKCENYKPERSHHCKTCQKCVLKMDHHCPWTMNCIGHENLPHFLRFVGWLIFNSIIIIWKLSERAISYYQNSSLPSYLINKSEMVYVILFLPITTFLAITVLILYVRCIYNLGFKGMTQIEVWEWERVESQIRNGRIWKQIKINYRTLHGKELPRLVSWSKHSRYYEEDEGEEGGVGLEGEAERRDSLGSNDEATGVIDQSEMNDNHNLQPDFTIDDLIFPYDLGIWRNLTDACGSPFMWLLPFGSPRTLGYEFVKNEFIEDDQLGLPWPPDGGHQEGEVEDELDSIPLEDLSYEGRIRKINRLRDPRNELKRLEWMNDLGETLDDFGVDLEAEDTENDHLIAK